MVFQNFTLEVLVLTLFFWLSHSLSHGTGGNLHYLYTRVKPEIQGAAATGVIQRLFPNRASEFRVEINADLSTRYQDSFNFRWDNSNNQMVISGTTGVSALFGLNFYLKRFCKIQIAWEGSQLTLPNPLPPVVLSGNVSILDRFRYFQNVCTQSYSYVWWDWAQWEKHIDWMALNGINFPLAFTGQEIIWQRVYLSLGLNISEIQDYITGPAFLAWWRMGNLQKWGGPLPRNFALEKLKLQHKILDRMRRLGMLPILPAFAGNVPPTLPKLFPNSTFFQHPSWGRFNSTYSWTYALKPTDPLFIEIGKRFNHELVAEYGTDNVYNCDTFNENRPLSKNGTFLRAVSKATYKSMLAGDPKAIWVMQGWLFTDTSFWTKEAVRSYLSGVQVGNLIVLDLFAELKPMYSSLDSFFGHSFIWCMLHNFGGQVNLYGTLDLVNEGVAAVRGQNVSLIGTGMAPEGINQNFVVYDFMSEMSVQHTSVDVDSWIQQYAERRYGTSNSLIKDSWKILRGGVYNAPSFVWIRDSAVILNRPDDCLKERIWYPMKDTQIVVENFVIAAQHMTLTNSTLFHHDLVDFTRQFLQHSGALAYKNMMDAYKLNKTSKFRRLSETFLAVFDDMELILQTSPSFSLSKWVHDAESWATTLEEKQLLRFNSLNQITLWGPTGQVMDYAAKQWSGMISNYYKARWVLYVFYLKKSLMTGNPVDKMAFAEDVLNNVEIPFAMDPSLHFPNSITTGDPVVECTRIYHKWKNYFTRLARNYDLNSPDCELTPGDKYGVCIPLAFHA